MINKRIKEIVKLTTLLGLALLTPVSVLAIDQPVLSDETFEYANDISEASTSETVTLDKPTNTENEVIPRMKMRNMNLLALPTAGPYFGTFIGSTNNTDNIYTSSTSNTASTYVSSSSTYSSVVAVLDEANNRYKIAVAGTIGWVAKKNIKLTSFDESKGYNHYKVNSAKELVHYLSFNADNNQYAGIVQGLAPDYLKADQSYLSFDGHYFYPATKDGYINLVADYNAGNRSRAINAQTPFYNYFQYLPVRSQTNLTKTDLRNYLTSKGTTNGPSMSQLFDSEQLFIDIGNVYGGNGALGFVTGIHESGFGTSSFAKSRNNFFGHNAVDSAPGLATAYPSPGYGITNHFANFLNIGYVNINDWRYFGGFVGNKEMGMNVKYASDPYWGEKIAAHYYHMDKMAGYKDYGRYTIGLLKNSNINIRTDANTSSAIAYQTKDAAIPIVILGEKEGTEVSGSKKWYRFSSEQLLDKNKVALKTNTEIGNATYNYEHSQLYIHASFVDVVHVGKDSKLLTQTTPVLKSTPKFDSAQTTLFTISDVNLRPDWSTDYTPFLTVPKNTQVSGVITDNGWVQVVYGGRVGYLSANNVSKTLNGTPLSEDGGDVPETPTPSLPQPGTIKYEPTGNSLRVRQLPNTSAAILTIVNIGDILLGGEALNGWVRVKVNNVDGYVSAEFIKKYVEVTPEPTPTPTVKLGDINNDGKLSAADMSMLVATIRNTYKMSDTQFKAADINEDGKLSAADMSMLVAHIRNTYKIKGW